MPRLLSGTRYLVIVPIIGLAVAAAFFFIFGGVGLIRLLLETLLGAFSTAQDAHSEEHTPIIVEVDDHDDLIVALPRRVSAFRPLTG